MSLPSLNKFTLVAEAADVLRREILGGRISPGTHLVEAEIADELDVSRATVREALHILSSEGLVLSPPRKGSFVVELTQEDIKEIYEVRLALESAAAIKLCSGLTSQQEQILRDLVDNMRTDEEGHDFYILPLSELDMRFHENLCEFSGNRRLWQAWKRMGNQLKLVFAAFPGNFKIDEFAKRHEAIVDAIVTRNRELVRRTMRRHIHEAMSRIVTDTDFQLDDYLLPNHTNRRES